MTQKLVKTQIGCREQIYGSEFGRFESKEDNFLMETS